MLQGEIRMKFILNGVIFNTLILSIDSISVYSIWIEVLQEIAWLTFQYLVTLSIDLCLAFLCTKNTLSENWCVHLATFLRSEKIAIFQDSVVDPNSAPTLRSLL